MVPQSFTPRSRLIADITSPPKNPIRQIIKAMSAACSMLNGGAQDSSAPTSVALAMPPIRPSQGFDGDRDGATLCLPNSLPQTYCNTSLPCTTITRKAINNRLWRSNPSILKLSRAGTWLMQNTEIITPHWILALRSRNLVVSLPNAESMGKNRNAYTGIKIEYKPYQSFQISRYCIGRQI